MVKTRFPLHFDGETRLFAILFIKQKWFRSF